MLPFIIGGAVALVVAAAVAIFKGPTKENETYSGIENRLRLEEAIAAQKRKNEEDARKLEREREEIRKIAANQKRQEDIRNQQAEIRNQRAKMFVDRKTQDEERQKAKEEERIIREKYEKDQRELARRREELKVKEQELKKEMERAKQMAREAQAARVAEGGYGPLRWPTREEFQHALQVTQYDSTNFHFAIVGRAGSGKSSLINAFRNLKGKDVGAAQTGTTETTLEIGRYPDPGKQPPRQWMVWFDIPGAGTQRISHYDYFVKQGLYVFDLIVLAIGDRFEEIDVRILENCARFKIPAFIVRSKADMHILNSMGEYGDYKSINGNPELYAECRNTFITATQQTVSDGLARQGLPDQPVYIVSRSVLQRTYNNALKPPNFASAFMKPENDMIHERHLVKDLLSAATQRRCNTSTEETPLDWVKNTYSTVKERFSDRNHEQSSRDSDISDFLAAGQGSQTSRDAVPTVVGIQEQPAHKNIREIRKVIYPYQPISSGELYEEISRSDPELPNMLIEPPCMFTPRVALLRFYPLAPIPQVIFVFGSRLRVQEYKEKEDKKTKKNWESHVQTTETEGTASGGHKNTPVSSRGGSKSRGKKRGGRGGY